MPGVDHICCQLEYFLVNGVVDDEPSVKRSKVGSYNKAVKVLGHEGPSEIDDHDHHHHNNMLKIPMLMLVIMLMMVLTRVVKVPGHVRPISGGPAVTISSISI